MLKFLFILASLFIVGYLIVHDTWMITITAFGYEVTTSLLFILLGIIAFFYVIHVIKKPLYWWGRYKKWYQERKQSKKEAYLLLALKTVLDQNENSIKVLLKQKTSFFDKKSDENFIIDALFNPTPHVFEQLLHRENTELSGIRGLINYAKKTGDYMEVGRLLQKGIEKFPKEVWIQESLWECQIMQNDWAEALKTLDSLKKKDVVTKDEYVRRKASILLKLGHVKEAYKLLPTTPEIALAYALQEPKRAQSIIMDLWKITPCWDAYLLFEDSIKEEKPTKQIKLVEKLVHKNPDHKLSLLALAKIAMNHEIWGVAKDHLTACITAYPLTKKMAQMMAEVERKGWHHDEEARQWDSKEIMARNDSGWECTICGHKTIEWDATCPKCNAFNSIKYQ